jgi:SNF2 family DNA or RNA helicase
MEMGTGKSAVALALVEGWKARRVIIFAPLSVLEVWPKQFRLHAPRPWSVVIPSGKRTEKAAQIGEAVRHAEEMDLPLAVLVNYDAVGNTGKKDLPPAVRIGLEAIERALFAMKPDAAILDEVHRIGGVSGSQSHFVARYMEGIPHKVGLTGTPLASGPVSAYGEFRALAPRALGVSRFSDFRSRYCVMGGFQQRQIVAYRALDDLERRMAPYTFRVRSADVLDLPPFLDDTRTCRLSAAASKAYRELGEEFVTWLEEGVVSAGNALVKITRLAQLCGGNLQMDKDAEDPESGKLKTLDTAKADALADLLADIAPEECVVVFSRFTADLAAIHAAAKAAGRKSIELSGQSHPIKGEWIPQGETVLACQIKSGSLGIDLTCARYVVFFCNTFEWAVYEQARKRTHRPGQNRPVEFIHLEAILDDGAPTIDRRIMDALQRKGDLVEGVLEEIRQLQRARCLTIHEDRDSITPL